MHSLTIPAHWRGFYSSSRNSSPAASLGWYALGKTDCGSRKSKDKPYGAKHPKASECLRTEREEDTDRAAVAEAGRDRLYSLRASGLVEMGLFVISPVRRKSNNRRQATGTSRSVSKLLDYPRVNFVRYAAFRADTFVAIRDREQWR